MDKNRLQFRFHDQVFDTRETAIEYIQSQIRFAEQGLASEDPRYGYSLLAEPTILLYKNVTEQDPTGEDNPHLIIALGSKTNDGTQYSDNRFCIIDIDKTEQEIADLQAELEAAIKSLTLVALSSDTLNFYANKTEDGTFVSGDVKVADSYIFDNIRKDNNLMVTPEGLFIYVNLEYDEENESFTFYVSNADGTLTETVVKMPNNYVVRGYYSKRDESIHLIMKNGDEVLVNCENLIAEWGVEGDGSKTPVVLTREEIDYDGTDEHHHVEPWQDVLRADVRIKDEQKVLQPDGTYKYVKDENSTNILNRTSDGRYLYVDGKASNIIYYKNGQKTNVKEVLDELGTIKLSSDSDNILVNKPDGFFASTKLEYKSKQNKLIFKASGQEDTEIQLNGFKLFENIYYDPTQEALVITYIDGNDKVQIVTIPIGEMIRDWEWEPQNEGHNVKIVKKRNVAGNDKVSADAKIYEDPDNILVDKNHELFVKGTADNIKYGDSTVKNAIDNLKEADENLDEKINNETERAEGAEIALDNKIIQEISDRIADVDEEQNRAEAAETELSNKIGTGFTSDPHDNVTYKFEMLQNQVNEEADKLQNEIDRSTAKDDEHDGKIQAIEDEIGEGFGPRNTVRDEIDNLQSEIEAVSADSASSIKDIINIDKSINIDKTDSVRPIISVNLSEEIEHGKENIIKLNADGLYAGVDLSYEETANKLIFSTTNGSKEIQLDSMSSIIDIQYNPTKEAIVITYMTNGHEVKTVEIPVGDLINEWRVEDGHPHAVQLEKVRIASGTSEQDVLKASVIISDSHDDNILVMDDGSLYVPGTQIRQNAEDIIALNSRMNEAEGDIDTLEINLANEISRALSKEESIETKLDSEIVRSTEKDTELDTAINNEIARSTQRDQELSDAISSEASARTLSDNSLQNAIDNEAARAANAEAALEHSIEDEAERRQNADNTLNTKIESEITRASNAESRIENALNDEIDRATTVEGELNSAITNEILRAQGADNELYQKIADETNDRIAGDSELNSKIDQEISRAQVVETTISERLTAEINRSTSEDQAIRNLIETEIANREEADAELAQEISDSLLTFDDTSSVDFNIPSEDNNIVRATVKLQEGDNIIKCGQGLYASVHLSYNSGTNRIKLVTSNGEDEEIQLVGASLLENLVYDSVNKELVITYKDATGVEHSVSFGVEELFNDWIVQNPSENSAVKLVKTPPSAHTSGSPDVLYGKILITDDHNGDGKPDQGSDNIIEIRNNGLYVDGSAISGAVKTAECAKNELKAFEKSVLGHMIAEECGTGYLYEPNAIAAYINNATSFNNADYILDQTIKNTNIKVDEVSAKTDCADNKVNKVYELLYGSGETMPICGEGESYKPYLGACIISAATSFNEADRLLNDQICGMMSMWESGQTCTAEAWLEENGGNKKLQVDARLSRGKSSVMTDNDLVINSLSNNELTDTNVLRIVCLSDGVNLSQNGIYLSNIWDCGELQDGEMRTYNYMNNVRQNDPLS